ncbi:MAG: T9SS type A sorting domain-containing protein [Ignavibacteria bacterium]|nr:T9SS type A sorting domain-containing protein [Ignavibacteria bacterium]
MNLMLLKRYSYFTVVLSTFAFSQEIRISQNFRIHPSNTTQTEVFVTVHPFKKNIVFASANTIRFQPNLFISEGVYVSTNAGISWSGNDTCNGYYIPSHGGDPGIAIDKDGKYILTRLGRAPFYGLFSHYSVDSGQNWSSQKSITTDDLERAVLASDANPTSNYYGRTYSAWAKFVPPFPIAFSYTINGAVDWSSPRAINNPSQRCSGGDIVIANNGNVFVCWGVVTTASPIIEIFTGFASSSNGGTTWFVKENAFAMKGIQGLLPEKQNIRVNGLPRIAMDNSGGERNGWLYIVTAEKNLSPAGSDADIILHRSTDDGNTWSNGIRVNQDALNNGKIQYFPAIHIDDYGAVNIIYYDDRTTSSDSANVFLSRSLDGGNSWSDYLVSDHNFRPEPIGGLGQGYQGDNISLTSSDNCLLPLWMDNSSGVYQIWTTRIDVTILNVQDTSKNTKNICIISNYPNPFNPETIIRLQLQQVQHNASLKIFDIQGNHILTLFEKNILESGYHEFRFHAANIPSGIYFYRFATETFVQTKKFVVIR